MFVSAPPGAGLLVTGRQILTCAHVVNQALGRPPVCPDPPQEPLRLDFPLLAPAEILTAETVLWEPAADVAGLALTAGPPPGASPARLVTAGAWWDHRFRAFGFPAGHDQGVWAAGRLRGKQADGWVQIEDANQTGYFVQPGFSGGPVWDEELDGVAGVTVAADTDRTTRAAFIIPSHVLIETWPALAEQAMPPCPYRGLFAFRPVDAPFFFGRETMIARLVETVPRRPLTALVGPSGSGKSSVIFAGLVPALRRKEGWLILSFRPGDRPLHALAAALLPLLEPAMSEVDRLAEIDKLSGALREGRISLEAVAGRILARHDRAGRLLLIVDQFEELYALTGAPDRRRFLEILLQPLPAGPAAPAGVPLTLLPVLRADFLSQVLADRPLADWLQDADVMLGPMEQAELERAIVEPARKLKIEFESGLVERILADVGLAPGRLPLLAFALTQLWSRQNRGRLSHAAYEAIGRVDGALTGHADRVYDRLSLEQQGQARRLFIQLVQPGAGTEDTRRLARREELASVWTLARILADNRLVVTGRQTPETETVEIVHEALIQNWGRLRAWMQQDRTFRAWQERLRQALGSGGRSPPETRPGGRLRTRRPTCCGAVPWPRPKGGSGNGATICLRRSRSSSRSAWPCGTGKSGRGKPGGGANWNSSRPWPRRSGGGPRSRRRPPIACAGGPSGWPGWGWRPLSWRLRPLGSGDRRSTKSASLSGRPGSPGPESWRLRPRPF